MPTTPPSEGSSSSIPAAESTTPTVSAGPSRTIRSFFGGSSASASSSASAQSSSQSTNGTVPPKKRRKKDENQAKLSVAGIGSENVNWVMGKPEPDLKSNSKKKAQQNGGEEDELKEMVQKGKARKGKRKSEINDLGHISAEETESAAGHIRSQELPTSSPPTQRGKPPRSQANSSSIDYPSASSSSSQFPGSIPITISDSPDHPGPTHHTAHRPSIEFQVTGHSLPSKRPHPFFDKSKGIDINDAIEVDQNSSPDRPILLSQTQINGSPLKAGPKKIAFAADKKTQHSFFSRLNASNTNTNIDIGLLNGPISGNRSRASSINSEITVNTALSGEIPSKEREKGKSREKEKKKVHTFFKGVASAGEGVLKNGWGNGIKEGEELITPLPSGDWPNHLQEPTIDTFNQTQNAGPSRRKKPIMTQTIDNEFWSSLIENARYTPQIVEPYHNELFSTPSYISDHPAFTSIPFKSKPKSNRESWCDRYKPWKSAEMLSNETETTYLKDWLSVLSVGHHETNGRKVVRKVKRGGLKSGLVDGWIVDDIGLFGETPLDDKDEGVAMGEEEVELEELDDPPITANPDERPATYPSLESRLTNTILLTGPHGSGKTAAVYATAHELGWDVFEVFPGMGKRTGGNLMSWVGDVGKNHMVAQDKKQITPKKNESQKKGAMKTFFSKAKPKPAKKEKFFELGSQGSAHEPIDIDDDEQEGFSKVIKKDEDKAEADPDEVQILGGTDNIVQDGRVRQSLILIDEADLLFDEESTFWPAVISLIAESRRPVILTCNDHNLIPKFQLPLQAILQFRPPPSQIALPYLQAIATQEAKNANRSIPDIQSVYEEAIHQKQDILDQPLPPNGNERIPYFDLRKAIDQLQLERGPPSSITGASSGQADLIGDELAILAKQLEITSYTDAWVNPKYWMTAETTEVDRHYPTTDDQLGIHALIKPEIRESFPILAGYDYCDSISDTLISSGGGLLTAPKDLALSRVKYIRSTLPILDPLIPLSSPLLPNQSLFLYTLPTILSIIEVDDILEAAEEDAVRRGEERINRKTGRPMRGGQTYTRWLSDLDHEAEEAGRSLLDGLKWRD
ncbi:uncharacterized protein L201_004380 [Kwoniella dendrophila CBS 6074]|uniref:AAA+ ATPase domain-containing protein n=1 Tax=Kwoniella dendrophila CBS 6074 TaxID=1295534 RepID=A0AAX4JVL0_9TREE